MIKFLPLLAFAGLVPFLHAEEAAKPAEPAKNAGRASMPALIEGPLDPAKLAAAIATPVGQRTEEQKSLVYSKIVADGRARHEKERQANVRTMVTVRAEKIDLAKLLEGKLTDAEGKPVSLDYIKKARYVAFYHSSSWCCGCKQFTPQLQEVAKKYAPGDIAFVLVAWDNTDKANRDYMNKSGIPWATVSREAFKGSPAYLAINSIPHLRVYDASGAFAMDSLNEKGEHGRYAVQFADLDKLAATKPAAK